MYHSALSFAWVGRVEQGDRHQHLLFMNDLCESQGGKPVLLEEYTPHVTPFCPDFELFTGRRRAQGLSFNYYYYFFF